MDDDLLASIDLSPIATVVTDPRLPDNPIVAVNPAFAALTGYGREAIGRNCRFLAGERTVRREAESLRDAVAERRPGFAELINYRKDGSPFLNAVMIAPRFDEAGALRYFLGSQMDVTGEADASGRRRRAAASFQALTPRQREVLRLMAQGLRNKQIAAALGINEKTVKMHRVAMLANLGARTPADAVRIAVEAGL